MAIESAGERAAQTLADHLRAGPLPNVTAVGFGEDIDMGPALFVYVPRVPIAKVQGLVETWEGLPVIHRIKKITPA